MNTISSMYIFPPRLRFSIHSLKLAVMFALGWGWQHHYAVSFSLVPFLLSAVGGGDAGSGAAVAIATATAAA